MDPKAIEIYTTPNCITFTPDSRYLVGGDSSAYVRQWKVESGHEVTSFRMKSTSRINAIATSMDGQWIVTTLAGNGVVIWDAVTRTVARQISDIGQVYAVDVSSDSTRIVSGSDDRNVRIFNIISGDSVIPPLAMRDSGTPIAIKFSPDGDRVATVARSLHVYDAHSGNKLLDIPVQNTSSLAWSFDGQQLLFCSLNRLTCFGESSSPNHFKLAWFNSNHNNHYNNASVVTHGRFVACATGLWVSFWDYTLGKQIGNTVEHATVVNCVSISSDGSHLACGHQQGITVHNLADILPWYYLRKPRVPLVPLVRLDDPVLEPWMLGNLTDAESILSEEIKLSQPSDSDYRAHVLAARSIIRARMRGWRTAREDAEMSLQVNQSPIGRVARSLALVGADEQQAAIDDFDLVFRDCEQSDNILLLVIKFILVFMCGKHKEATSRLHDLLTTVDEKTKGYYTPVLGNMYLKQGDYENAVQTLALAKKPCTSQDPSPLITLTLIFDWKFDRLEDIACQRLCESLHPTGRIKEVGETLSKMIGGLAEDKQQLGHGRVLEELVTRSGQVTLLMWTGKSSRCNSCLPNSPAVYSKQPFVPPRLEPVDLAEHTDALRAVFPLPDALMLYAQITRFQPVRFANFRLLLPCIVYSIKSLKRKRACVYHAETAELGDVEFKTVDSLPFEEPQRLVFADLRIHGLKLESDTEWNSSDMGNRVASVDAELVHAPMIEEVPSGEPQLDTYTRALQLIARLAQPFSALLLLQQSDGSYKRIAADYEIIVHGTGSNRDVPKDIRVEVLEIL